MMSDQQQEVLVHIRWMIRRDLPEVLDIEADSFEFPWYEDDFVALPATAQLHRHGRGARRSRHRFHDLRIAQVTVAHSQLFGRAAASPPGRRASDDRQTRRQTLAPPANPDHAGDSRNKSWRAVVLPRRRLPRRLGGAQLLRRHARRRLRDAIPPGRPKNRPSCYR